MTQGCGTDWGNAHQASPADVGQEAVVKNTASTVPRSAVLQPAGPVGAAATPGVRAA